MNNTPVDASSFIYNPFFQNNEFEQILTGIIACYYCIVEERTPLPSNDENKIRDIMLSGEKYLKNQEFRMRHPPLGDYQFDKETVEDCGILDIRILSVNPYFDDYAYYAIECKRISNENQNGISGLNGEYIREGIVRFTSNKYPFYKRTAGMIGFVIAKMDISQNVNFINNLLKQFPETNTVQGLKKKEISNNFEYVYCSDHNVGNSIKYIYHLMLDFSANVAIYDKITDNKVKYTYSRPAGKGHDCPPD